MNLDWLKRTRRFLTCFCIQRSVGFYELSISMHMVSTRYSEYRSQSVCNPAIPAAVFNATRTMAFGRNQHNIDSSVSRRRWLVWFHHQNRVWWFEMAHLDGMGLGIINDRLLAVRLDAGQWRSSLTWVRADRVVPAQIDVTNERDNIHERST